MRELVCREVLDKRDWSITLYGPTGEVLRRDTYTEKTFPAIFLNEASDAEWIEREMRFAEADPRLRPTGPWAL